MAYENLKSAIKQAIKQNGNQEITGNLLQSTLLNMVNTLGVDYKFLGFASPSTVPPTSEEGRLLFYFASEAGEYNNFPTSDENTYITIGDGLYMFTKANGDYWKEELLIEIDYDLGNRENAVISQKISSELFKCASSIKVADKMHFISTQGWIRTDGTIDSYHSAGKVLSFTIKYGQAIPGIKNLKVCALAVPDADSGMAAYAVYRSDGSLKFVGPEIPNVLLNETYFDTIDSSRISETDVIKVAVNKIRGGAVLLVDTSSGYQRIIEPDSIEDITEYIGDVDVSYITGYLQKKDGVVFTDVTGDTKSVITDYYKVSENQKFKYIGKASYETASVCYYDYQKKFIKAEQFNEGVVTIPSGVGVVYARFASYSYTPAEPKLLLYSIDSGNVNNEVIKHIVENTSADVLSNKIWVACGDSFTEGVEDYVFEDQPYKGKKKVYPFYIGRRNKQLTVINEAKAGSTISETSNKNLSFSYDRYKNIRKDADYITLWFGINDSYTHSVEIGTIEDTNTATYYGAWNVVLSYLIENHPNAKIGIVISNAMNPSTAKKFALATVNVAKKFGIPYLDLLSDDNIPYFLLQRGGTKEDTVSKTVKSTRDNYYAISNSNEHPNYKAHLFESTIIENWLRSL